MKTNSEMQLQLGAAAVEEAADHVLDAELRAELMKISTQLKTTAAAIDAITHRKKTSNLDANGELTFRYGAKVPIPSGFYLTKRLSSYATARGFDHNQINEMVSAFIRFYAKSGKKWADWARVWMDWVRREEERKKTATGPRVVSNETKRW
jgi:hypothetical protein